MFTCGLLRSNFSFAIVVSVFGLLLISCLAHALWAPVRGLQLQNSLPLILVRTIVPGDDLFRDRPWRFFVLLELHGEIGAALCRSTHRGGVAEHLRKRHRGADGLHTANHLHAFDAATARVQVADD